LYFCGKTGLVEKENLYRVALTRVKGIGDAYTRTLIERFGDARSVFNADGKALLAAGIPKEAVQEILRFHGWAAIEAELLLLEKKGIRLLFFTDAGYPRRLNGEQTSPPLLFYRGNADLNAERIVAVVGTRRPSDYGRQVTEQLIRQMAQPGLLIISGLALGIDTAAHQAALEHHLPTVGILGHGFGHLYPPENKPLAQAMLLQGGLLTSLPYCTKPEAYHFPDRNWIVAALCDALLVVETARKGGSLLTVEAARKWQRPVFAVPGRIMDTRSAGCNWLIRQEMATMLTSGEQLPAAMGWIWPEKGDGIQATLRLSSPEADPAKPEHRLLLLLKEKDGLHLDEIATQMGLAPSALALALLNLELAGLVSLLPGMRYGINMAGASA
jgi:DNA processing protein